VAGHGFGKGGAALDIVGDGIEGGLEQTGLLLLPENLERPQDGQAGILQGGSWRVKVVMFLVETPPIVMPPPPFFLAVPPAATAPPLLPFLAAFSFTFVGK